MLFRVCPELHPDQSDLGALQPSPGTLRVPLPLANGISVLVPESHVLGPMWPRAGLLVSEAQCGVYTEWEAETAHRLHPSFIFPSSGYSGSFRKDKEGEMQIAGFWETPHLRDSCFSVPDHLCCSCHSPPETKSLVMSERGWQGSVIKRGASHGLALPLTPQVELVCWFSWPLRVDTRSLCSWHGLSLRGLG